MEPRHAAEVSGALVHGELGLTRPVGFQHQHKTLNLPPKLHSAREGDSDRQTVVRAAYLPLLIEEHLAET